MSRSNSLPSRRRRTAVTSAVGATVLLATAACGGTDASGSGDTIKVGVSIPTSGPGVSTCLPILHGAQAFIDKVNADDGVNGKRIEVLTEDDKYTAAEALTNARQFTADPDVVAIYNACGSAPGSAIQSFAKQQDMPFVFSWVDLPGEEKSDNFYTLVPGNGAMVSAIAAKAMEEDGAGSLYLMAYELPGIDEAIDEIKNAVEDAGGSFLGSTTMTLNQADMNAEVLKAKSLKPDYIATIVNGTDSAKLINTIDAQDAWPAKAMLTSTSTPTAAFVGAVDDGVSLEKVIATSGPAVASDPSAQSCLEAFEAYDGDYEIVPDSLALTGCTNAQALVASLQSVKGDVTRESYLETLATWTSDDGVPSLGALSFTKDNHLGVRKVHGIRFEGRDMVPAFDAPLLED
ncbi:ABC transporter substrate-binding protein [Aeromicrobium sp. YIM 150415]|uniref:ABC transporter substrate-binding protein n=1 Tax=Aeromicrobium sp. YIM 150415 TaxID=2803912 RepID=UPI001964312B|nr:ABC transporter substrate-binding protein [Aeromicrobium sp. YIM 150415]MBM9464410.1 ABC transporter substrate-binding protein [Aeromicrobium sp. YIM 150415]